MKLVKLILILILTTILFAIASLLYLFAPNYASKVHYRAQTINITRNEFGIPFVQAPSKSSLLYAYGWVIAEDRPFQITFRRLVAEGRLSEFLGEQPLVLDKFMREIDISGWGQKMAARLKKQNASQFQCLQAVVDGMNDQMASRNLPLDFYLAGIPWMNWTVSNLLKTYKLVEFSQSVNAFDQIYRSALLSNYSKEQIDKIYPSTKENWAFQSRTVIQDEDIPQRLKTNSSHLLLDLKGKIGELLETLKQIENLDSMGTVEGSNSWIISGRYTQSGQPILANDPHMAISIPSSFYQFQGCYYKNNKKFCGQVMTLPGSLMMVGKYDYASVVPTTIYSDNIDFYRQKIQEGKHLVDGQWRQLKLRKELIKVKTAEGVKHLQHMVRQTHRGPVISYYLSETGNFEVPDLSFQWTGANDDYSGNLATLWLWQADSLENILKNFPTVKLFNFNILMITKDGHSIAQRYGWYPIRKYPEMGNYIKDGTTTDYDWAGFVPFEDRLTIVDPKAGYIVAANNKGASQIYYDDLHKYHSYTARADRITDMIEDYIRRGVKINVEIVKKMMTDTVDSYCQRILPKMLELLPKSAVYLKNFDCDFTAHSTIAPVYELFFSQLHHLIKIGNFQTVSLLSLHHNYQYLYNFVKQAQYKTENKDIIEKAWQKLMENSLLSFNNQGKQTKRWGEIHKDNLYHNPFKNSKLLSHLYNRQFEGRGNMHTVDVGKMNKVSFANYEVSHRAQNRAIYSYSEPSFWLVDTGVNEQFYSKHYDDQWKLFKENRFIEMKGLEGRSIDKNQL